MDETLKKDEEQIVEDTDADTRDVEEDVDYNNDLDEGNSAKLDDVLGKLDAIADAMENLANLFVRGGGVLNDAVIDEADDASDYEALVDLDYSLDELDD